MPVCATATPPPLAAGHDQVAACWLLAEDHRPEPPPAVDVPAAG
jgi:hypothetical protein